MALTSGTAVGAYEIVALLGQGGMGEVYRARDTRLGRDVALKLLPELFASDPERLARFQREAQVLASLNHPAIAQIYGLEDGPARGTAGAGQASGRALVLELVEGPTLADRIAQGALPADEAFLISRQIAEALEAAHEQGIVHRDLKPANIKVRPDGQVKVLDFGLAKLAPEFAPAGRTDLTMSPTLSMQATFAGVILGTAGYMSPEQAKGRAVDRRADIWAFGVVLWEMLTGRRMYDGETAAETLARVIERDPDLAALPTSTPETIRTLLQRCLTKDPRTRLQAIGEARIALDRASASGAAVERVEPKGTRATRLVGSRAFPWALAAVLGTALVGALVVWAPWRTSAPPAAVHVSAEIGADASLATDVGAAAVLSPDGKLLAFAAQKDAGGTSQLYVRRLDQLQASALAGTDDARAPFFSPDGQWLAFFAGGRLKKVAVTGGAVVPLSDAPNARGGSWGDTGTIVYQPDIAAANASLALVSSAGGRPEQLPRERDGRARFPQVLPGGKAILYTKYAPGTNAELVLQTLPAGERRTVLTGAYGRYVSSGHIVYLQEATLFAVPFDLQKLAVTGQAVPVLQGVLAAQNLSAAQLAVSDTGTLVYVPGEASSADSPISWMDRGAKTSPLLAKPLNWGNPQFAPDGRRIAIDVVNFAAKPGDGGVGNAPAAVWVYDLARDTLTRLTLDAVGADPVWTPDGVRITYRSNRDTKTFTNLYWQRADGAGETQRLTESRFMQFTGSWHPSGKYFAYYENSEGTNPDIWILPMDGNEVSGWKPGKPTVFLRTPAIEQAPAFSPDGRWLAYHSNESGAFEVYVRPFPGPGGRWQISSGGGQYPTWSRARSELYFNNPNLQLMVASYRADGESFQADRPQLWSDMQFVLRRGRSFDVHPDGNRVAMTPLPAQESSRRDKVVFVFNFFDELRRLAPVP